MHRYLTLALGCVALFLLARPHVESAPPAKAKDKKSALRCPVAGVLRTKESDKCPNGYCARRVNPQTAIDYKGGKIAFCCRGCVKKFKTKTKDFATNANFQLAASGQAAQKACPFSGEKVNTAKKSAPTDVAGVKVTACCDDCQKKLEAMDLAKRLDAAFGEKAFARAFVVGKSTTK